jgi:hypothetical protein
LGRAFSDKGMRGVFTLKRAVPRVGNETNGAAEEA